MKKPTPSPVNRGFLSIEVLLVLLVIMLAAVYGYPRYARYLEELEWGVEARNMTAVGSAAKSFIRDNREALTAQVSGGPPVTITAARLQTDGYLPPGFGLRNGAAQSYTVGIARDPTFNQKLVAFVLTTGGREFSFRGLRYISQKVDGAGGYVWPANVATGAFAGWEINLGTYGLSAARGHIATWLSSEVLGTDLQESDRLYRYQVSGRPDLNRMHTDIDMNGSSLNKAKDVSADTGTFGQTVTAQGDIKSKAGWLMTGSGKGWMNEAHGGGLYMDDNSWIKSVNGKGIMTSGQLKGGSVRSDGQLSVGNTIELDRINTVGQACPKNGNISRNAAGATLSCQNLKWVLNGGQNITYTVHTLGGLDVGKPIAAADTNLCYITGKKEGDSAVVNATYSIYIQNGYWIASFYTLRELYVTCARFG